MLGFLKKINVYYVSIAIFCLVFGIVCICIPSIIATSLPYILGSFVCVLGIAQVIKYFTDKKYLTLANLSLISGVLNILIGIFIFINATLSLVVIATLFGIWILINGLMNLNITINKAKMKLNWGWDLVSAITQMIVGIVLFVNFNGGLKVVVIIAGCYLVFSGIMMLITKTVIKESINDLKKSRNKENNVNDNDINENENNQKTQKVIITDPSGKKIILNQEIDKEDKQKE